MQNYPQYQQPQGGSDSNANTNTILLVIVIVLLALLVGGGVAYLLLRPSESTPAKGVHDTVYVQSTPAPVKASASIPSSTLWKGKLPDIPTPIGMELNISGTTVSGRYYTDFYNRGAGLKVRGVYDPGSGAASLRQTDGTGTVRRSWDGVISGGTFSGTFTSGYTGERRQFNFSRVN